MHIYPKKKPTKSKGGKNLHNNTVPKAKRSEEPHGEKNIAAVDAGDAGAYATIAPGLTKPKEVVPYQIDSFDFVSKRDIQHTPLGENLEEEKANFLKTIEFSKDLSEGERTKVVLSAIQSRFAYHDFSYQYDVKTEGVEDFWSSPNDILKDQGQGIDCDDFTTMAKFWGETAKEAGFIPPEGEFAFVTGQLPDVGHAVCVYYAPNGEEFAVDGTMFSSGPDAIENGSVDKIYSYDEYKEQCQFEQYADPVKTFEDFTVYNVYQENGVINVDMPRDIEGIDLGTGESVEIFSNERCKILEIKDNGEVKLELESGKTVVIPPSENFNDTLKNLPGGYATDLNGEHFSMKDYSDSTNAPNAGYYPEHLADLVDRFSPKELKELMSNPALFSLEVTGTVAEAFIPSVLAMRKYNTVKKRYKASKDTEDILKTWLSEKKQHEVESKEKGRRIDKNEFKDLFKIAPLLDVRSTDLVRSSKKRVDGIKGMFKLLSLVGDIYIGGFDKEVRNITKLAKIVFPEREFSIDDVKNKDDIVRVNKQFKQVGIQLKYQTSKKFGKGELVRVKLKLVDQEKFLKEMKKSGTAPLRKEIASIIKQQKQELNCFATLKDYNAWKLKYHKRRAIKFGVSAVVGTVPDMGISDMIKAGAYDGGASYLDLKDRYAKKRIYLTSKFIKNDDLNISKEEKKSLLDSLENLSQRKETRNKIKYRRTNANVATHVVSGVTTLPSYLGGPIGVGIRRGAKGATKLATAMLAEATLQLDQKKREKEAKNETVVSFYKKVKKLHKKRPDVAIMISDKLFGLNQEQFELLIKTKLVEQGRVKLSVSEKIAIDKKKKRRRKQNG
jgi:hypothetical protein